MEDERLLDASEDDILVPNTQDSPATFSHNLIKRFGICRNSRSTDAAYTINNNVYNIGLSVTDDKEYIIQFNIHHAVDKKYLVLKHLKMAFQTDPDLHLLPRDNLNLIMQCLYISSGCDYISYFKSFGKATILNIFSQYANFITGSNAIGNLHQTNPSDHENGFLSFLRLVGTCYFKKHIAAFIANYGHSTPVQLYNSTDNSLPPSERHQLWLQKIRQAVSNRIVNEEERVPTCSSLWRHWLRSCWVHQTRQRSIHSDLYSTLPPPEHSGWIKDGDTYSIDWEAAEGVSKIRGTITFLTKGCSCKKGRATNNCGCRKKSNHCGPGCECQGCTNLPQVRQDNNHDVSDDEDNSSDNKDDLTDYNSSEESEELETEVIIDEFLLDSSSIY